jgi:hypothetical protein
MFSADYWFQPNPGPMTARAWLFYAFYTLVFLGCLVWAGQRLLRPQRNKRKPIETGKPWPQPHYQFLSKFEFIVGLAGLMLVGARLAIIPGWSARIWPLLMVGLALSGPVAGYWSRRPTSPFDHVWQLLALRDVGPPLPRPWQLALWTLHLLGLSVWARAAGLALWWAAVLWGMLLLVGVLKAPATRRLNIYVAPLTPLFFAYASGGLYLLLDLPRYPFLLPLHPGLANLWWLPFYFESVSVAAILYTLLVELFLLNRGIKRFTIYILSYMLIVCSLVWLALELFIHRTHGVTGTDPYGYTQMAVDLATRSTLLHRFDVFPYIADLTIAWAPVIALGYHLPLNALGDAASVWPPGMSILLAGGYRLFGETGLYLTGPVLALPTALVVGWLTAEMSGVNRFGQPPNEIVKGSQDNDPTIEKQQRRFTLSSLDSFVGGSLALFVWATSYEVIDRALVPMADMAVALFTTLVWIALLKMRISNPQGFQKPLRACTLWALTAGVALGLAFEVRYTQLMLVVSVGLGLGWLRGISWRQRIWLLLAAGGGALITVLPDIVYRWQVFGSPLANPQARELTHFALVNVFPTLSRMLQQLFLGPEFGLLAPFLLAGLIWQWQRDRRGFITLAAGALAVLALQLPYESLRLRDLLSLFPLLAAWTGLGMAWTWRTLVKMPLQTTTMSPRLINALIVCVIFLSLLLPIVRVEPLVTRTWRPHRASFGYVTVSERVALTQLTSLTPAPAAIGTHLNGGAIALHSQRWPFYPGGWTEEELDCFLARMAADDVPVFLLDDGPSVRPAIERLSAAGRLRPMARLDIPLPEESGSTGQLYEILRGAD